VSPTQSGHINSLFFLLVALIATCNALLVRSIGARNNTMFLLCATGAIEAAERLIYRVLPS
jgi:hypothetical protein